MKKFLFIVFWAVTMMAHAQTITIGEGSGMTTQVPFNTFYNYSFTEQLFLASEIEFAGNIKAVSFRIAYSYNSEHSSDIAVYLKNVSRNNFADPNDYESVSPEDRVFSGSWTIPADYDGWITIDFDTPFAYNGTDNLLIAIDENSDDYAIRYFRYSEVEGSTLSYYDDNINPDPYELGAFNGSKEMVNQRANTKLVFGTVTGVAENNVNVSVYPNPASNTLFIDGAEGETVTVYDAMGRLVRKETYTGQLNIGNLKDGFYAVSVGDCVVRFTKK